MTVWVWPSARIVRVIDGDSIVASLTRDIGFHGTVTFEQHLRLNRINAAPIGTETGRNASLYVQAWMARGPLHIETVKPYKYGDAFMAEVYDDTAKQNLSEMLVAEGLAVLWDGSGTRPGG